ncbi:uncharacterized protein DUF4383 [Nocardiopsis sp. Huas11]|uniref:DUF4383 domain-containing protein n=1 Tax=Nocardiopsis sp. Huas11 TaxID=2183912 RepID=UPI000EAFE4B7|nr:DUF4383 domain-containing protein [Nocardiopsis sp. Huas11]RKS06578.1 uncharacterized protein DUF4383 [Nocardiopsis sp. Huas11]
MSQRRLNQKMSGVVRSTIRVVAFVVGIVFLLVGVLGFVPGATTGVEQMEFSGPDSGAYLFGIFQVSVLHNIVHLAFGVLGVVAALGAVMAKVYLLAGGVLYLLLWLYGLFLHQNDGADFLPLNEADNWLHLALGVVMVAFGFLTPRKRAGPV